MSLTARDGGKRISFIDQCKGIGILLMIRGHCATLDWEAHVHGAKAVRSWIYSFHMPLFFLLGGCLLAYRKELFSFPRTLEKKASRLLLPGFFFSVPMIVMHGLIKLFAGNDYLTYLVENTQALLSFEFYSSMWFLTCYFCAETFFLLLMTKEVVKLQPIVISAVSFVGAMCIRPGTHIMARFSRLMMAICFVSIGYWSYQALLSKLIMQKKTSHSRNRASILLILGGVLLALLGGFGQTFNGEVSMVDASYGKSGVLFLLYALAGTYGFTFMSIGIGRRLPIIEFFGRNSLTVLCTHMFFIDLFWILNSQLFHLPLSAVDARLFAMGVILLEAPTILIINKYFPWLIGLKK